MAVRDVIIPSQSTPFVDSSGRISPVWHQFLFDLYQRTGGGDDSIEATLERIDFDIDFELS